MADVFVSYASEDRDLAALLVASIENAGLSVWWDLRIGIGTRFDVEIEEALERARCVVVIWSTSSIDSHWVRAEAGEGLERGDLIQVVLDDLRPPLVFRQHQAFRFIEQTTDLRPFVQAVERTVRSSTSTEPLPKQKLVLLADFENRTGDPILTGTLTAALEIGLDHVQNFFLYPRDVLLSHAERFEAYVPMVRAVAEKEGLDYVLGGTVNITEEGYELTLDLLSMSDSEITTHSIQSADKADLMPALASGIGVLLDAMGPEDAPAAQSAIQHLNLACVYEDQLGFVAQARHEHQQAVAHFQAALVHDESFVPSYIGLAISFDCLDRQAEGSRAMKEVLNHLEGLSERERLRTLSMYYLFESENLEKALEHSQALLKISPMEAAAINNDALIRCSLLDFEGAIATMERAVSLAPDEPFYRVNLALYSMYAGDLGRAMRLARTLIADGMGTVDAYVALGCSAYASGDSVEAVDAFTQLLHSEPDDRLPAIFALADLATAGGEMEKAISLLEEASILSAVSDSEASTAARVQLMHAEILVASNQHNEARSLLSDAFDQFEDVRLFAEGAVVARELDDIDLLNKASAKMKRKLDSQSQAYVHMVEGLQREITQDYSAAERAYRDAIGIADLWMLRYASMRLYERLDMKLEAKLEREECLKRSGEGVTALINRMPTCRYLALVRKS